MRKYRELEGKSRRISSTGICIFLPYFLLLPSVGCKDTEVHILFNHFSFKWQIVALPMWANVAIFTH